MSTHSRHVSSRFPPSARSPLSGHFGRRWCIASNSCLLRGLSPPAAFKALVCIACCRERWARNTRISFAGEV